MPFSCDYDVVEMGPEFLELILLLVQPISVRCSMYTVFAP